ncbi:MAG: HlyD family type I secretion periplasmic adaptor subunit [Comamonadaceae bacterium]|nr:HlyD family type I secretion periplasmic adaptor subunit [Comamonadaceae bacterium]
MNKKMADFTGQASSATPAPARTPLSADAGRAARTGLWALGLGFGGFLLWAGLAPLDEGVPAPGLVTIDTKRKPVQHLTGGIVKEVLVREGDQVKSGQVLVRLDDAMSKANFESVRQRYLGLRAMQGRLQAEQLGLPSIRFHADLLVAAKDPLIGQQLQTQQQLFESRRLALKAAIEGNEAGIHGQEGVLEAYAGMFSSRQRQLALLQDELENTRSLVRDGYAPRNRQLELERMVADSTTALAELQGNRLRGTSTISELRQRIIALQKEYRKEVETQLADVTREVLSDEARLLAVTEDLARNEIKAPVAGQVLGLAVQTPGSVLQPGQKLMDVVPDNEALLLEVHVAPHLIDKVHAGLFVDVRFSAFAHAPQLVVQGVVQSISNDLMLEPQTNVSYYLARVKVTSEGMGALGKHQMQPGMPIEVVFKTGERSLLTYLLHPLTKRMAAAMKEE